MWVHMTRKLTGLVQEEITAFAKKLRAMNPTAYSTVDEQYREAALRVSGAREAMARGGGGRRQSRPSRAETVAQACASSSERDGWRGAGAEASSGRRGGMGGVAECREGF